MINLILLRNLFIKKYYKGSKIISYNCGEGVFNII